MCSAACIVALHVLRSDLGPVGHRLSEYANGSSGWLMTVAFLTLGGGMIALGSAVERTGHASGWWRAVPIAIVVAGAGMVVAGLYPTDPEGRGTRAEAIHSRASGLATVALIAAAVAWSLWPRGRGRHQPRDVEGVLAVLALVLGCLSPVLHETRWTGVGQRLLWATLLAWLALTAWKVRLLERGSLDSVSRPPRGTAGGPRC